MWRVLALFVLIGCAQKPLTAPSGMAIDTKIGNVGTNVNEAKKYNDLAVVHNAKAMTAVERIEAKAQVLKKYWK